jgi:hypothetical protein
MVGIDSTPWQKGIVGATLAWLPRMLIGVALGNHGWLPYHEKPSALACYSVFMPL